MPEGDTIRRVAGQLTPLLLGVAIVDVQIAGVVRAELAATAATAITPIGKHLVIDFANGWQLRIHLGMYGRWRRYRAPLPAPASSSLILRTAADSLACLRAYTVELTARRDARRGRAVASLGPDVLAADFDPALAATRALARGGELGVVLLDQRVAAGIGNIYKSEALYAERLSPFAAPAAVGAERLTALYRRAHDQMRANLGPGPRRTATSNAARYFVYRRSGRPCPRCGTRIRSAVQGTQLRRTYWCPTCQ